MGVAAYRSWSYAVMILIFDWMPMRVLCRPERQSVVLVVRR